jgi:hypothetical protein
VYPERVRRQDVPARLDLPARRQLQRHLRRRRVPRRSGLHRGQLRP